jgi:hypothetical protein
MGAPQLPANRATVQDLIETSTRTTVNAEVMLQNLNDATKDDLVEFATLLFDIIKRQQTMVQNQRARREVAEGAKKH